MPAEKIALLSLRPRFAEALLDGTKTAEIRRRRAHLIPGSLCLVYASTPVCALVGAVRVGLVDTDTSEALWRRWGPATALNRDEYDSYLIGSARPCAIIVNAAARFHKPIALPELRRRHRSFVTPQSYRFVDAPEAASLMNGQLGQLKRLIAAECKIPRAQLARVTG